MELVRQVVREYKGVYGTLALKLEKKKERPGYSEVEYYVLVVNTHTHAHTVKLCKHTCAHESACRI